MLGQFRSIDEVEVAVSQSYVHTFTDDDLDMFTDKLVSDAPIYRGDEWTRKETGYGRRVVNGVLTAAVVSRSLTALLFQKLQLNGIIHLATQKFLRPVYTGDILTVTVRLVEILKGKNRIQCSTDILTKGENR
ncbi:MAG: MaoC/PaaZ C-terminal domain-containing protein [Dehalococcoidia bacterium]|jgi:acyl dehydratase|nr:MaoC/PaaZ C-terminal domain-containing protein [Dehalococcoidia bacterium]MDP7240306.1 MaoC/PaaZ C-terminal domain-containing protein [Dehalococcoidia bacterium]